MNGEAGREPSHPALSADSTLLWLHLAHTPGLTHRVRRLLLEHFGSIDALLGTTRAQLERAVGERLPAAAELLDAPDAGRWAATLEWLARPGCRLVIWFDPDYPRLLREIADPPVVLYVHGRRELLARAQLGVVGSRNPTPVGRDNARAFARALAGTGLTITSGLALGVDGAAHRGALEAGGATVAVTGTGLDRVYPPRHRELAHAIAEHGALVSEFALGTPPRAENFPIRNRLIAGLALGVLVVEAAERSGSLITARLASEAGREVFAIPGSIHSPLSRGCHRLIRQGAKLVETAQDIIEELGALARFAEPPAPSNDLGDVQGRTSAAGDRTSKAAALARFAVPGTGHTPGTNVELTPPQETILDALGFDAASVDTLVERSGLTADAVSSILLELELLGLVAPVAGGKYQRTAGESGSV